MDSNDTINKFPLTPACAPVVLHETIASLASLEPTLSVLLSPELVSEHWTAAYM